MRLVAELLYSGLTTGAGIQTLGEEYCDILQVAGASALLPNSVSSAIPPVHAEEHQSRLSWETYDGATLGAGTVGVAPSFVQRSLLILLERMGPYFAERISSAARSPADSGSAALQSPQHPAAAERVSSDQPAEANNRGGMTVNGAVSTPQQAWARAGAWAAAAKREAMNAASKWRPAWAVLAGYAPVSARLHLALFYFYGVYYHWAKRATGQTLCCTSTQASMPILPVNHVTLGQDLLCLSIDFVVTQISPICAHLTLATSLSVEGLTWVLCFAGTRYLFVGKLYERRPSYHLLGVLLFVQLGISAGTWALSNLASSLAQPDAQRANTDIPASTARALKAAIVLQVKL